MRWERDTWGAWERREKCTRCWCESPKERGHSEDQGVDGRMGSEWILGRLAAGGLRSESSWLRIYFGGRLLYIRWWTFRFWRYLVSYLCCEIYDYSLFIFQVLFKRTPCYSPTVFVICPWHYSRLAYKLYKPSFSLYFSTDNCGKVAKVLDQYSGAPRFKSQSQYILS
jgi:hypothetical protein